MAVSRRRSLVLGAAFGAALALSASGFAQPSPRVYRVAFLASVSPLGELIGQRPANPAARAFADELRKLGFVEGRNLVLDMRTLEGRLERLEPVVIDMVRHEPDAIFFPGQLFTKPAVRFTGSVPIVTLFAGGVVETGLVKSYARPGGTVTGVVVDVDAAVEAKRLELLLQMIPRAKRIAFLGIQSMWENAVGRHVRESAGQLGLDLYLVRAEPSDFSAAFGALALARPDAVYVPAGPTNYGHRREIGRFLAEQRLPSSCAHGEFVEQGCLMSYGVDVDAVMRRAAAYVAKILRGAKPGDLPVEQPTKFELVINMNAARALGVGIPDSLRARTDRVIE
jgi:putative ABC transport system substrate-binding protein